MFHIRVRAGALIIENGSILLAEFCEENGLHYNLPAGGVEKGESLVEAVKREAMEEAGVDVEVGPIVIVYEYEPGLNDDKYGSKPHEIFLLFDCKIKENSISKMPKKPDLNQTGVKWVSLTELNQVVLYPKISTHILKYANNKSRTIHLIEEQELDTY